MFAANNLDMWKSFPDYRQKGNFLKEITRRTQAVLSELCSEPSKLMKQAERLDLNREDIRETVMRTLNEALPDGKHPRQAFVDELMKNNTPLDGQVPISREEVEDMLDAIYDARYEGTYDSYYPEDAEIAGSSLMFRSSSVLEDGNNLHHDFYLDLLSDKKTLVYRKIITANNTTGAKRKQSTTKFTLPKDHLLSKVLIESARRAQEA